MATDNNIFWLVQIFVDLIFGMVSMDENKIQSKITGYTVARGGAFLTNVGSLRLAPNILFTFVLLALAHTNSERTADYSYCTTTYDTELL